MVIDQPVLAFFGSTRPVNVTPGWTLTPSRRQTFSKMDWRILMPAKNEKKVRMGN